ncbi:EF-hand domain-containing protein [Phenylobacterium sp.]|uniref:EF-hand domain-containing protein n=1 Tax=Phenylobacterium sp. TaxID=1871053 RepID=UPI0027301A9E|nr:EF-hand domain-containing protein [Phenylobacterium sp.]MDP1619300.1 EF-hand domain-containing protein [Phenylobacterium sp.]MDP1987897.1 EF-hand domain-containing protein [Phenylobacterium sp.]
MMRLSLLVLGLAVLATPALAQMRGQDPFADADTNRDGQITLAEYQASRAARFDRLDRDRDGVIGKTDFPRVALRGERGEDLERMISAADRNRDGALTREELLASPPVAFAMADANDDGVLTAAEMASAKARLQQMRSARR